MNLSSNPTFKAYRSDMSLQSHIARAFLEDILLTREDAAIGSIQRKDGTEWGIILEGQIVSALEKNEPVFCIGSFQHWHNGTNIVVLRMHRKGMSHEQR